jgi:inorganic pyrophosphatase
MDPLGWGARRMPRASPRGGSGKVWRSSRQPFFRCPCRGLTLGGGAPGRSLWTTTRCPLGVAQTASARTLVDKTAVGATKSYAPADRSLGPVKAIGASNRAEHAAHAFKPAAMSKAAKKAPHAQLPPIDKKSGAVNVVIETPRACRNKFKFDEKLGLFRLNSVLPAGSVFPFDFGYVPGTRAEDGDPLDVLLLMDEPVFTGCLVQARLIGVLEAEQQEDGKSERNDRLLGVACDSRDHQHVRRMKDVEQHLLKEIEHFFVSYHELTKTPFKVLGYKEAAVAKRLVARARE